MSCGTTKSEGQGARHSLAIDNPSTTKGAAVPNDSTASAPTGATPTMRAAEAIHARAVNNGAPGSPGSFATSAVELLAELTADRDRLAAELVRLKAEHTSALDIAYDEGWSEGCGSAGVDFGGAAPTPDA